MNEVINKYILKLRSPKLLITVGLIGIVLIAVSSLFSTGESKSDKKTDDEFIIEEYRLSLEKDICDMVSGITGSKKVTAVVTLESGIRYSYADIREEISSDKTEKESSFSDNELKEGYITVKTSDGGEQALLVTTQMPEIRGVAIVCEGGDIEAINQKIMNTVTAALNITSKRVYICGRNTK